MNKLAKLILINKNKIFNNNLNKNYHICSQENNSQEKTNKILIY